MRLRILHVPDCPTVAVLEQRLAEALAGRPGVEVAREQIATAGEAAARGMAGSPTLLVDGVDPFAGPGSTVGLSCRVYPDEIGQLDRAPTLSQLRRALGLDPPVRPAAAQSRSEPRQSRQSAVASSRKLPRW